MSGRRETLTSEISKKLKRDKGTISREIGGRARYGALHPSARHRVPGGPLETLPPLSAQESGRDAVAWNAPRRTGAGM